MGQIDYLFIRLLEGCNAGCSMCGFARSSDKYRLSESDFQYVLKAAKNIGVNCIRFTGGEPLLHRSLLGFIESIREAGLKSSIITNGSLLSRNVGRLKVAGLDQVIVSIDASNAEIHDKLRNTPGLFRRAIEGLELAIGEGMMTRVNTVCGPGNFREMPLIQKLISDLGVHQWELSSLKLERPLDYSIEDQIDVEAVIDGVYVQGRKNNYIVPFGKIWCGNTKKEREEYFKTGVTPRPDGQCHIVDRVRYLDAKRGQLFACSLIPHRLEAQAWAASCEDFSKFDLDNESTRAQAEFFRSYGPLVCTGCSTTAAGASNEIGQYLPRDMGWWY